MRSLLASPQSLPEAREANGAPVLVAPIAPAATEAQCCAKVSKTVAGCHD
jgi:hypothetical protein